MASAGAEFLDVAETVVANVVTEHVEANEESLGKRIRSRVDNIEEATGNELKRIKKSLFDLPETADDFFHGRNVPKHKRDRERRKFFRSKKKDMIAQMDYQLKKSLQVQKFHKPNYHRHNHLLWNYVTYSGTEHTHIECVSDSIPKGSGATARLGNVIHVHYIILKGYPLGRSYNSTTTDEMQDSMCALVLHQHQQTTAIDDNEFSIRAGARLTLNPDAFDTLYHATASNTNDLNVNKLIWMKTPLKIYFDKDGISWPKISFVYSQKRPFISGKPAPSLDVTLGFKG